MYIYLQFVILVPLFTLNIKVAIKLNYCIFLQNAMKLEYFKSTHLTFWTTSRSIRFVNVDLAVNYDIYVWW